MSPPRHRATLVTPPGTGAIAVIRIVGPAPMSILQNSFVHAQGRKPKPDGKLLYGRLMDGTELLDDVLVSMEAFGEEQAVDISCHGGVRIVQRILELLERGGSEVEVDQFAALSYWPARNKIEEEAIEAIALARTQRAARYAALLRTELPREIQRLSTQHATDAAQVRESIARFLRGYGAAKALLRGITVALVGPPNSGKSTLFNTLLGRGAVVTSPVAGTTRDWIKESVEFEGVLVNLIDTAGRRETGCDLERLAIVASESLVKESAAVFFVFDGSNSLPESALSMFGSSSSKTWVVANKCDLGFRWKQADIERLRQACGSNPIQVSASLGTGCEFLRRALLEFFELGEPSCPPLALFTVRQASLAEQLINSLAEGQRALRDLLGNKAGGHHDQGPIIGGEP